MARKPIERTPVANTAPRVEATNNVANTAPSPPAPSIFTNSTRATTIHLGDGRKVAPGESVEVTPELLRILEA